ncbi:MAG TPA: hypothetical protein VK395_16555 [Gemmataceae bacterium]|nr:hypothetical protein [Gemmataceae bacterium]
MSIWHEITQGVKAVAHPGPSRFVAGGLPVRCPHCKAEQFIEGSALLSTVGISFAHLNWATEKKVTNLMCDSCGLIQWFGATPQVRTTSNNR